MLPAAVVALLLLAVVAVVLVVTLHRHGHSPAAAAPPTTPAASSPTATPTPTPPATPTSTPTPSPTAHPTHRTPHLTPVPSAPPHRLTAGSVLNVGFDDAIEPVGGVFRTRSTAELSRWGSRGEPASPGTDTVYVAGRIAANGESGFGALPKLRVGDTVTIRSDAGYLTYTVRTIGDRDEATVIKDPAFLRRTPGRLILIGVRYDAAGNRSDTELVVTAQLSGAKRL